MHDKKQKIDVSGAAAPLTDNPFAALRPPVELPSQPAPPVAQTGKPAPRFRVARTKKGGFPISLEKRGAGKTVTIVGNISGDAEALLAELKKRCAAGGKSCGDTVEIQGDHRAKVEAFLRTL